MALKDGCLLSSIRSNSTDSTDRRCAPMLARPCSAMERSSGRELRAVARRVSSLWFWCMPCPPCPCRRKWPQAGLTASWVACASVATLNFAGRRCCAAPADGVAKEVHVVPPGQQFARRLKHAHVRFQATQQDTLPLLVCAELLLDLGLRGQRACIDGVAGRQVRPLAPRPGPAAPHHQHGEAGLGDGLLPLRREMLGDLRHCGAMVGTTKRLGSPA